MVWDGEVIGGESGSGMYESEVLVMREVRVLEGKMREWEVVESD